MLRTLFMLYGAIYFTFLYKIICNGQKGTMVLANGACISTALREVLGTSRHNLKVLQLTVEIILGKKIYLLPLHFENFELFILYAFLIIMQILCRYLTVGFSK